MQASIEAAAADRMPMGRHLSENLSFGAFLPLWFSERR